jgi:D-aminopeptidase
MLNQKRIRDFGIVIGELPTGEKNAITDVAGVTVGHVTIKEGDVQTGVTALIPHGGNIFREKLMAAVHVINGFGKSVGLIQIDELGTMETPVLLTNTFGVGTSINGLVRHMLNHNIDIGDKTCTVNPVVFECNDSYLNDIRGMHIKTEDIESAIQNADSDFPEGAVGAGTGMSCYKLKGGIGSASRLVRIDKKNFTVGMLVLTNMGRLKDLTVAGRKIGSEISASREENEQATDKGSIIMLIATDLPMTHRQLKRIAKRAEVGVARTGNDIASGSGEIVLAFSTAQKIKHYEKKAIIDVKMLNEEDIDVVFKAVAECSEEAVLNSMITADRTIGKSGRVRESLSNYILF